MQVWTKGGWIPVSGSGGVILLVLCFGILVLIFNHDMEVMEKNAMIAKSIEQSVDTKYYVTQEDWIIEYRSYATSTDRHFTVKSRAIIACLNKNCMLLVDSAPSEIISKYTADPYSNKVSRIVLSDFQGNKILSNERVLVPAMFEITKP